MCLKQKLQRNIKPTTFLFGDFEVQWKILKINALQVAVSENFQYWPNAYHSIQSIFLTMIEAQFEGRTQIRIVDQCWNYNINVGNFSSSIINLGDQRARSSDYALFQTLISKTANFLRQIEIGSRPNQRKCSTRKV